MTGQVPEDLLLLGKVIRPHGLDGALRVLSFAESEKSFLKAGVLFIRSVTGETRKHEIRSIKPHKKVLLLELEALSSLEEAEKYRDADILIDRDTLQREEGDEYFWFELLGLDVYLKGGTYLGKIGQIVPSQRYDIYVVNEGKREVMIPATHEFIEKIDLENKRMVIHDREGLLDLNEV
ncbi:MAG: ribosome maturation factor RimM [Pseudomonadota bacterium]